MITHPDSIRCDRPSAMCCVKYGKTLPPVSNINNLEVFSKPVMSERGTAVPGNAHP